MSGVKTRGQATTKTGQKPMEAEQQQPNGFGLPNGLAKSSITVAKTARTPEKQENIFLFIPNIIGSFMTSHLAPRRRF